jgi:hypothetical protein
VAARLVVFGPALDLAPYEELMARIWDLLDQADQELPPPPPPPLPLPQLDGGRDHHTTAAVEEEVEEEEDQDLNL